MRSPGLSLTPAALLSDTILGSVPAFMDRASTERSAPATLASLRQDPATRYLLMSQRAVPVRADGLRQSVVFVDAATVAALDPAEVRHEILLGRVAATEAAADGGVNDDGAAAAGQLPVGAAVVALGLASPLATGDERLPSDAVWRGYRETGAWLGALESEVFLEAQAILGWNETHGFCPRCGSPTGVEQSGWVRRCVAEGTEIFPRMDPAIIVSLIGPDGRILLGGGGPADGKGHSVLAGFVDPGESLEQAVVRELSEEVAVTVDSVQYLGSQAWPFPQSLMLGFTATTLTGVARPDGVEVTHARWFDRHELQDAVLAGEVVLPGRLSIARDLIEHWYGGLILDPGDPVPAARTSA
ncbi:MULTISPECIES: NAD(+) diphosphatase [Arthrobacter]|uniref:NAD(+) diphosphatase n=2 Tax=Arthrobacter TaxID=1663 RepID=A0ABU9KM11_9MICC|nr:NAD(+) diphosphatase [Arthrobacter sp. YJM1]MDP5227188.1 NAD(+) diphosphatase [Arthrobacter sp. YJM1]